MSKTKPVRTCSVSKDDVVAHEGTSLEHVIKMEEVDLKPDYIVYDSDGYIEMTDFYEQTGDGNELVNSSNNDSKLTSNMDFYVKEEIISQHYNDGPETYLDEEIKKSNEQDTEVKPEIDTDAEIISLNEHEIPNDLNTEMRMEQTEESDTDVSVGDYTYLTEASNTKNSLSNNILKGKNQHTLKVKPENKNKLNRKTKTYMCNDCTYKSVNRTSLIIHLITHTGEKPLSCSYCGYKCANRSRLTQHIRKHMRPFSCHLCKFTSATKSRLTEHLRRHDGEKPFSCNLCQYKGKWRSDLKTYLKKHKPFSCDACDFKCRTSSHLKQHLRKSFSCDACDFKCRTSSHLKIHLRRHTGEKPFSCDVCDYKCITSSDLKQHFKKHTGEKPFTCDVCDYKCIRSSDLKRHFKKHTGEKPFSCDVCDYKCVQSSHLKIHLRKHEAIFK